MRENPDKGLSEKSCTRWGTDVDLGKRVPTPSAAHPGSEAQGALTWAVLGSSPSGSRADINALGWTRLQVIVARGAAPSTPARPAP